MPFSPKGHCEQSSCGEGFLKKKNSMGLGKGGQADFIQAHCDRYRDHCDGISQWGEVLGSTQ